MQLCIPALVAPYACWHEVHYFPQSMHPFVTASMSANAIALLVSACLMLIVVISRQRNPRVGTAVVYF